VEQSQFVVEEPLFVVELLVLVEQLDLVLLVVVVLPLRPLPQ